MDLIREDNDLEDSGIPALQDTGTKKKSPSLCTTRRLKVGREKDDLEYNQQGGPY